MEQVERGPGGGGRNIHAGARPVKAEHLDLLIRQLEGIREWWQTNTLLPGALVDVEYRTVVPKSNRIQTLLRGAGIKIVGARFSDSGDRHIITHYAQNVDILDISIAKLTHAKAILESERVFGGEVSYDQIADLPDAVDYASYGDLSPNKLRNIVVDAYHVSNFKITQRNVPAQDSIVTIYDIGMSTEALMHKIGIDLLPGTYEDNTLLLSKNQVNTLNDKAPFLAAMSVDKETPLDEGLSAGQITVASPISIPSPTNEPIVGVIDTAFSDQVYFHEWVDYRDEIDKEIPRSSDDHIHGTSVTSIVVDGPTMNPGLDDGCGRFRVRHFNVVTGKTFNAFTVMKLIRGVVQKNPDIKVWNLSLGSKFEINKNSISPVAAMLDRLQYDYDIIFVVSGTNKESHESRGRLIGSPADSINSVVVNAVNASRESASYSRKGTVLSFYNKPDVCVFGGDDDGAIRVCLPTGQAWKTGTSFAAPWVTRKLAYLIHVLGMSREAAKALIIDAAAGWDAQDADPTLMPYIGHGIVPTHIDNIVKTSDSEIRFVITGTSKKWDTYNYNLPIPVDGGYHPFVARATLCYFPNCSIDQGVDYTNTELDLYFGRIADGKLSSGKYVKAINGNVQQALDGEFHGVNERDARILYRKWDNTKRVQDKYTSRTRSKVAYEDGLWGLSVKTNERLNNNDGENIRFGIVATLKEINDKNRISTFIQKCQLRGWLVEQIDVDTQVDIYAAADEEVDFS
ncbi:MAG TPA: S8 family peptidase [Candidatus Saccharibacteria bacterium]|nr:S8 family peptidase [Candidatus Saccharibacteria bacterium]